MAKTFLQLDINSSRGASRQVPLMSDEDRKLRKASASSFKFSSIINLHVATKHSRSA